MASTVSTLPQPTLPHRFEPLPSFLNDARPRRVWERFNELRQIPRPSKGEGAAVQWVRQWAVTHGFAVRADERGNLAVDVPASAGREGAPKVVLQAHLDMVCEKNEGTEFDFLRDAIQLRRDGDVVTADGTTLGADNGIGVAGAMAMAEDPDILHGPLELLFTLDEETGLNGVRDLDPALVTGDLLINLDTEDERMLTVGSAGAQGVTLRLPVERAAAVPATGTLFQLRVWGATGGHSGADIHLGRVNANKSLGEVLTAVRAAAPAMALVSVDGGSARNVIPREARALLWADARIAAAAVDQVREALRIRFAATDPHLRIELAQQPADEAPMPWTPAVTYSVLELLRHLPNGRLRQSERFPGLTQTSANLAVVSSDGEGFHILYSCRSAVMDELHGTTQTIATSARALGAEATVLPSYPSWELPEDSALLAACRSTYREALDREPEVMAVHGGLECAVLGAKVPRLDVISLGPDISNPHSPDELVRVSSVERIFQQLLPAILDALSR